MIYVCIDEYRIIWGVFENKDEAEFYANAINENPKCDTIIRVREYAVMPTEMCSKEFLKDLANRMV